MGWLFGWTDRKALIKHLIRRQESTERIVETLAQCCKGYTTLWALHQVTLKQTGRQTRFVVCYLLRRQGKWGYKDVDEAMGPNELSCPLSYIERATEPINEYSREWRERVKQYHQRSKPVKNTMGKMRKPVNPYEIWKSHDGSWEWRVLKKWQANDNKPFARWFCMVYSPIVPYGEMGDCYAKDIINSATCIYKETQL